MSLLEIIGGALLLAISVFLIVVIMLQESKRAGIGVVSGMADSYFGKNSGRTKEALLARITKIMAVAFFVITIFLGALAVFKK